MALLDRTRAELLIKLARESFDSELSKAELKVLRDSTCSIDPPESVEKGPKPEVSAEFIRWLATDPQTLQHVDPRGIFVWRATVSGKLDLWNCRVHSVLRLKSCTFHAEVSLQSAETRNLEFSGSSFERGVNAGQLVAHGSLWLDRVRTSAVVDLIGARIEGDLVCSGASLVPEKDANSQSKTYSRGVTLSADRAIISGAVFMNEGFESSGEVRMVNAKIGSDLLCNHRASAEHVARRNWWRCLF